MIRLYRAEELPAEVPMALFTDGEDTVLLVNPGHISMENSQRMREMMNSLLVEHDCGPVTRLRAAV